MPHAYDLDALPPDARARQAVLGALQLTACDCGACEPPDWVDAAAALEGLSGDAEWPGLLALAFAGFGDDAVEQAWQRGWMPQEAVGALRRSRSDEAVRAGAILMRGQLARYPRTHLSDRWQDQRDALAEHGPYAGVAEAAAGLGRWDRIVLWAAVLEATDRIEDLPGIPRVEPLPGSPVLVHGFTGNESSKVYERIRALLAKAESTDADAEAEAFTAKAQQLIARHSINEALLSRTGTDKREPEAIRVLVERPYESSKSELLAQIAHANHCKSVHWPEGGFTTLIGDRDDLRSVELLYNSLLVQATAAMTRAGSRTDEYGRPRTRSFRQSFLASFAFRIGERLRESAEDTEREMAAETGTDLVPVMRGRDEQVEARTKSLFPRLKSGRSLRISDYEGHMAGRAAADAAQLGAGPSITRS
ncbi:DUF2786 domain-containing protein [Glycomyces paridis]|uniref:DUF2786 domain-containing protein n=1 Tax=Glycomyces paridis TaxID=2126555 RepID=A0A4S8PN08_9ACTN|nr:DUF2786 domain-containing protein [Glycomyces paridis]THV30029.1 DUF2786 domain-containing protein [Glycomyces paridis]